MSQIEEYSSDEEGQDFGDSLTSTFLGFVDIPITPEELPNFEDTFIGSSPIWLHPNSKPPKEFVTCDSCNSSMALLIQTYANLENCLYDRILYVFSCQNPACFRKEGCVKAIRGVCRDPAKMDELQKEIDDEEKRVLEEKMKVEKKKQMDIQTTKDMFEDLKKKDTSSSNPFGAASNNPFGAASSNPFAASSNPFASPGANPFAKVEESKKVEPAEQEIKNKKPTYSEKAATKQDEAPKKPSKPASNTDEEPLELPEFPGFIVYMDQESLDKSKAPKLPDLPTDIKEVEGDTDEADSSSKGPQRSAAESEELAKILEDSAFENFSNITGYNPSQVLRYEINGKPLLYSKNDKIYQLFTDRVKSSLITNGEDKLPKLAINPSPYATRRFEFQLMPKMIIDLEKDYTNDDMIKKGMEWGTIIVATDNQDYVPELDKFHCAYVQEWCGVQWEDQVKRS